MVSRLVASSSVVYIIVEVLNLLDHPRLGLRLTDATTWKKEAEFARILKEITRKANPSFQPKISHL